MKPTTDRTAEHYLALNYAVELIPEEGGFFARHPDLDGCISQGDTADEAVANLSEARQLWIGARIEEGMPVPEPADLEASGRFLVRTTSSLHSQLRKIAQRQGVSFNQLVSSALSAYAGGARYRDALEEIRDSILAVQLRLQQGPEAQHSVPTIDPSASFISQGQSRIIGGAEKFRKGGVDQALEFHRRQTLPGEEHVR